MGLQAHFDEGEMMMSELKLGDVVRLKSGSPSMAVNSISGSRIFCLWFIDGELNEGIFDAASLVIDEQKGSK